MFECVMCIDVGFFMRPHDDGTMLGSVIAFSRVDRQNWPKMELNNFQNVEFFETTIDIINPTLPK